MVGALGRWEDTILRSPHGGIIVSFHPHNCQLALRAPKEAQATINQITESQQEVD